MEYQQAIEYVWFLQDIGCSQAMIECLLEGARILEEEEALRHEG